MNRFVWVVGVLVSLYYLIQSNRGRVRLTLRASLYMWLLLFLSVGFLIVGE